MNRSQQEIVSDRYVGCRSVRVSPNAVIVERSKSPLVTSSVNNAEEQAKLRRRRRGVPTKNSLWVRGKAARATDPAPLQRNQAGFIRLGREKHRSSSNFKPSVLDDTDMTTMRLSDAGNAPTVTSLKDTELPFGKLSAVVENAVYISGFAVGMGRRVMCPTCCCALEVPRCERGTVKPPSSDHQRQSKAREAFE